jgi:hypothetical protein
MRKISPCQRNRHQHPPILSDIYELEVMRQQKSLSKWRSGFRLGLFTDGALNPGIVANRAQVGIAKGSLNAGHSLGRVKERAVRTDSHSCFASINRWCTNAMLARSNARDRVQKLHGPYTEPAVSIEAVRVLRWGNQGHGLKEAFASSLPSDGAFDPRFVYLRR